MKLAESASCYEAACVSQLFELLQKNCQVGRGYDVHAKKVNDFLNMTFGCMSLNQEVQIQHPYRDMAIQGGSNYSAQSQISRGFAPAPSSAV